MGKYSPAGLFYSDTQPQHSDNRHQADRQLVKLRLAQQKYNTSRQDSSFGSGGPLKELLTSNDEVAVPY
jgi:hypothetical protein